MHGKNLFAGVANSVWSAVINLAAIPYYLEYLGIEAYGLIGFFATTQALLLLLDMGITPTISREVARYSAAKNLSGAGDLLHTLAVIYWCIAGVIAVMMLLLAPLIAEHWLNSEQLSLQSITHAVMLMGLVIACRWPIGLYQGALIGAERITISSGINIIMVTFSSLGAIAVLAFISPTIEAFFIWQALVGIVYVATIRLASWRIIGKLQRPVFNMSELQNIWRFTAGMSAVGLTGLVFTQLDKVILSKMLGLDEFGYYMLATVVVSGLYILINPVFNVIYPRMSVLVAEGNTEKLTDLYRLGTRLFASILYPGAMILVVFSEYLVFLWTGDMALADRVAPIISVLAIGSALHGVMYFPYALQLAYGMTSIPLLINTILMIVLIPLLIFFTSTYGALGGALAWLVLHSIYLLLGVWLTHRKLLKGVGKKWLFFDVGLPLLMLIVTIIIGHYVILELAIANYIELIIGCILAFVAIVVSVSTSTQLRQIFKKAIKGHSLFSV